MIGDKRATLTIFLVLCSLLITLTKVAVARAAEDSWTTMEPMPTARNGFGVAVVNGKIYAIGGGTYLNTNEEYNPVMDAWITKTPMPTARIGFGIAVCQNKIYVIGGSIGWDQDNEEPIHCSTNEFYDPLTDTWETKTSMPTSRSELDANVVNGKIYLIGGRTGGQYSTVSLNEVYDPVTNLWTTKEPIPYPVVQYASAVVNNKIYIIGGQDEFHDPMNLNLTQIYDSETDKWSFGAPIPTVVWQAAAGATTGMMAPKRIYVIGGLVGSEGVSLNQVYNPENNFWTLGTPMPTPRLGLSVAVANDVLYAIGGVPAIWVVPPIVYAENEQYIPIDYIPEFPSWIILPLFLMAILFAIIVKKRLFRSRP